MRKSFIALIALLMVAFVSCKESKTYELVKETDSKGNTYETVKGDPLEARIYQLENGLKIYLAQNDDQPRIMTFIGVKAGAKNDPRETTGLAHYFEHIMFKGTDEIGTLNWEEEQKLISQISDLFEKHKATDNPEEKKEIYRKIDSVSQLASQYAIPNEYDKAVSVLGAKYTNAFTSYDLTAYMNDIPSNELERWLKLENERFKDQVLRIFHTELETVYEEFNMSQDNDSRIASQAGYSELFKNHPYGVSVLGKGEHLKNPSMVNIVNFKNQYYVPNNMAICLMGDLNFEETIELIKKYWGEMKPVENIPEITYEAEKEITEPIIKEVYGPDREFVNIYFRAPNKKSDKANYFRLIDKMLNNSQAGLIDLNLVKNQKVQSAYCYFSPMNDHSVFAFSGKPRKDQTLEEVKELLLGEVEKFKKGEFDDWLLEAVINDMKLELIQRNEENWAVYQFLEAFTSNIDWIDIVKRIDEMEKITKDDLVKYANEFFKENYVVVYKRNGENKNKMLVEKPPIQPVKINRDDNSAYFKDFVSKEPENINPEFINFDEKLQKTKLAEGLEMFYTKNTTSELAYFYFIVEMGKNHNIKLPLAINYLKYIGTDKYSLEDLNKEFYKLGITYHVGNSNKKSYVYLSGLDENIQEGLKLLEHLISNAKPDKEAYDKLIDKILKDRADSKLNKWSILWRGLYNYAKYGKESSFRNVIPEEELRKIDPAELTDIVKELFDYKHKAFYYGPKEQKDAEKMITELHPPKEKYKEIPEEKEYVEKDMKESKVYFCNYDMVQAQIILLSKGSIFDPAEMPEIRMFNEYYGGSMSSVIFQEMREAAGLAYSAYAGYTTPGEKDKSNYIYAFIATQPDKIQIAMDRFNDLLNNMVESEKAFKQSQEAIVKQINTERIIKDRIFWTYLNNKELGIDSDYRKQIYEDVPKFKLEDIKAFFNDKIKGKKYDILVLGNKNLIDLSLLKQYGPVEELTLEEIYNY